MLLEAKEIVIEFIELDDRTIVISRDYGFGLTCATHATHANTSYSLTK